MICDDGHGRRAKQSEQQPPPPPSPRRQRQPMEKDMSPPFLNPGHPGRAIPGGLVPNFSPHYLASLGNSTAYFAKQPMPPAPTTVHARPRIQPPSLPPAGSSGRSVAGTGTFLSSSTIVSNAASSHPNLPARTTPREDVTATSGPQDSARDSAPPRTRARGHAGGGSG